MQNEEKIGKAQKRAYEYERDYGGCAQSVLGALQEEFGIGNTESFKTASFLAGGIARRGETCGAIVGALSALGLLKGRERIEDNEAFRAFMDTSTEMCARFIEELKKQFDLKNELNSTLCRDIQEMVYGRSFDLTNQEGFQAFLDAGGKSDKGCPRVCGVAAKIGAEEISKYI